MNSAIFICEIDCILLYLLFLFLSPDGLSFFSRKLGWDPKQGEGHLDAMLRGEILAALAHFGHDVTRCEATRRFDAFLNDRHTPLLPPDTRKVLKGSNFFFSLFHPFPFTVLFYDPYMPFSFTGSICGSDAKCQHIESIRL